MNMHQGPMRKYLTISQLYRGLDYYLAAEQRDAFDESASLERLTNLMADAVEGEQSFEVKDPEELAPLRGDGSFTSNLEPGKTPSDRHIEGSTDTHVRRPHPQEAIGSNKPRWFLRNWPAGIKMLLVALLPVITVLVFGGVQVNGLMVSGLLIALICDLFIALSLIKPLRVLRSKALDVAHSRLPETARQILADSNPIAASKNVVVAPMPVSTREEIGQLARSFDMLHNQAVQLVTAQATLRENLNSIFANLSHRIRGLVERQLVILERLERDEEDPGQLLSLFELDHLATRMRRSSENLMVLAGTDLSRQLAVPANAADVLRAAMSEVERYDRIEFHSAPHVAVQGRAVSDLVRVIAELLDNATVFSPADRTVVLRMAITRRKELAVQITDQGVGMSEEEITATNARLADPPDLDVAVTRRVGLYVVGLLAKRHNLTVRLRENEDIEGGLIAQVIIPAELVQKMDNPIGYELPTSVESSSGLAYATTPMPGWEDAPTERLPIYEAVLSQWFEAANAEQGGSPEARSTLAAESSEDRTKNEKSWFSPREQSSQIDPSSPEYAEAGVALFGAPLPEPPYETGQPTDLISPTQVSDLEATPWTSPDDDGWRAAQALLEHKTPDATTHTGLPKRVPRSHLVPGSAAPRLQAKEPMNTEQAPPSQSPRSADAVRGRMSSFQQGVQRGRHAVNEANANADVNANAGADERHEADEVG